MNSQNNSPSASAIVFEPGVVRIRAVNVAGTWALFVREVRRFMKVQLQTIWAPAITTLLFLVIFTVALGGQKRMVLGVPFADFIAPGLIMMGMIQNSFANASFSLLGGKMNGTLIDYLMPPLSDGELLIGLIAAATLRAFMVGGAIWLAMVFWPGVHVSVANLPAVLLFGLLGAVFVGFIGVLTSIWADKFDHSSAVTNFFIAPMSLLSGTFYSVENLSPLFRAISHVNPFFFAISGFRYGFLGRTDTDVTLGAFVLLGLTAVLGAITYLVLRSGWKLKA